MKKYITLLILTLGLSKGLRAQDDMVHVVTKTIRKEMPASGISKINVQAEKAHVKVIGWTGSTIELTLKLISKNQSKSQAEADLKYHNYGIDKNQEVYNFSNGFVVNDNRSKIHSSLSAEYILKMPQNIALSLANLYGEIDITHLRGGVNVSLNFGQVNLTDIEGNVRIKTSYGDVFGENLDVSMRCEADKANLNLNHVKGKYQIESSFGKVEVQADKGLTLFIVQSKNTEVELSLPAFETFNYDLKTSYGNILLPSKYEGMIEKSITQKKEFVKSFNSQLKVSISTTFNDIKIQPYSTYSTNK